MSESIRVAVRVRITARRDRHGGGAGGSGGVCEREGGGDGGGRRRYERGRRDGGRERRRGRCWCGGRLRRQRLGNRGEQANRRWVDRRGRHGGDVEVEGIRGAQRGREEHGVERGLLGLLRGRGQLLAVCQHVGVRERRAGVLKAHVAEPVRRFVSVVYQHEAARCKRTQRHGRFREHGGWELFYCRTSRILKRGHLAGVSAGTPQQPNERKDAKEEEKRRRRRRRIKTAVLYLSSDERVQREWVKLYGDKIGDGLPLGREDNCVRVRSRENAAVLMT